MLCTKTFQAMMVYTSHHSHWSINHFVLQLLAKVDTPDGNSFKFHALAGSVFQAIPKLGHVQLNKPPGPLSQTLTETTANEVFRKLPGGGGITELNPCTVIIRNQIIVHITLILKYFNTSIYYKWHK